MKLLTNFTSPDIGIMVRVFAKGPGESYQRLKKWYLMPPCSTLSIIRHGSRVKWRTPGKGVAPIPAPLCSSYREGSLRVILDYGRQLYLLTNYSLTNSLPPSLSLSFSFPPLSLSLSLSIYIYMHIVIHRQTVSLYHNSSVWLDT